MYQYEQEGKFVKLRYVKTRLSQAHVYLINF